MRKNWPDHYSIQKNIEATLFCIKSVHDALSTSNLRPLEYLFEESTMAALPQSGAHRVRWTMLTLIGAIYAYIEFLLIKRQVNMRRTSPVPHRHRRFYGLLATLSPLFRNHPFLYRRP